MSDRYLYRAERTDNGEWVEGYYLFCPIQADNKHSVENFIYKHWIVTHNGSPFQVDPSTICQCAGLKDKNGKLIFENDIVKTNNWRLCKVFWFSSSLYQGYDLKPIESENPAPTKWNIWYDIEVIGNIFDNPELMNE